MLISHLRGTPVLSFMYGVFSFMYGVFSFMYGVFSFMYGVFRVESKKPRV